jgi:hypothetical protein
MREVQQGPLSTPDRLAHERITSCRAVESAQFGGGAQRWSAQRVLSIGENQGIEFAEISAIALAAGGARGMPASCAAPRTILWYREG